MPETQRMGSLISIIIPMSGVQGRLLWKQGPTFLGIRSMNRKSTSIEEFRALSPLKYGFLEALELFREIRPNGCSDFRLRLVMAPPGMDATRLVLVFEGVRDLRIGHLEGLFKLVLGITPIKDSQMEDLNYKVIEQEYDAISFSAANLRASLLVR